jgi:hypothetical protein
MRCGDASIYRSAGQPSTSYTVYTYTYRHTAIPYRYRMKPSFRHPAIQSPASGNDIRVHAYYMPIHAIGTYCFYVHRAVKGDMASCAVYLRLWKRIHIPLTDTLVDCLCIIFAEPVTKNTEIPASCLSHSFVGKVSLSCIRYRPSTIS